jgi:hypothetical protein
MAVPTRSVGVTTSVAANAGLSVVGWKENQAADAINAAPTVVFKIMQQFTTSIDPFDARAQGL